LIILSMKKRGLSPVVATVLLLALVFIIAIIIFLWAKSFVSEKTEKFGEPIENACENVDFLAEADFNSGTDGEINIENRGNVPLYGVEVRKVGSGEILSVEKFEGTSINVGETDIIPINYNNNGLSVNDEINIIPIILGEAGEFRKSYTCDEEYGFLTSVTDL
jgi:flagellin-like protein